MQAHRNHYTASMVMALLIFMSYHVFVLRLVQAYRLNQGSNSNTLETCSLIPRPRPAFHHLQYRKAGEGLG